MGAIIHSVESLAVPLVNPTVETAFSDGTNRIVLGNSGRGAFDGKLLRIRATFRITGGTTTNFTASLRWCSTDTSLTSFTNDVLLKASSAISVNTVTRAASFIAEFIWDSTSQRLNGYNCMILGVSVMDWAAFTNPVTGVVGDANIRFIVTGLFSATNANNLALLTQFELEQL